MKEGEGKQQETRRYLLMTITNFDRNDGTVTPALYGAQRLRQRRCQSALS